MVRAGSRARRSAGDASANSRGRGATKRCSSKTSRGSASSSNTARWRAASVDDLDARLRRDRRASARAAAAGAAERVAPARDPCRSASQVAARKSRSETSGSAASRCAPSRDGTVLDVHVDPNEIVAQARRWSPSPTQAPLRQTCSFPRATWRRARRRGRHGSASTRRPISRPRSKTSGADRVHAALPLQRARADEPRGPRARARRQIRRSLHAGVPAFVVIEHRGP